MRPDGVLTLCFGNDLFDAIRHTSLFLRTCESVIRVNRHSIPYSAPQGLGVGRVVVKRIVRVALCIEGVERFAFICCQGNAFSNSSWEIRIRKEVTTKRYCVGITLVNSCCCSVRYKSAVRDDIPLEDVPSPLRGYWRLILINDQVSTHAGLDDMQVSEL